MQSRLDFYQLFSQFILSETPSSADFKHFYPKCPLLRPLLPTMIKNLCHFMLDPQFSLQPLAAPYYFSHFAHLADARLAAPTLAVKKTLPHEVYQFMHADEEQLIFDSEEFGSSIVSKRPLPLQLLTGTTALGLQPFLDYAFSNDLWNAEGKWPRFHDRLLTLFNNKSILINSQGPGHYQLNLPVEQLENLGIKGLVQDDTIHLILSWSYPLSALIELEKLISQEF